MLTISTHYNSLRLGSLWAQIQLDTVSTLQSVIVYLHYLGFMFTE